MPSSSSRSSSTLLTILLDRSLDRTGHATLKDWFGGFCSATTDLHSSIDQAIIGGRLSQCVGFAFASGYQSAIHSLFGTQDRRLASLCVSEKNGNHPRAIETILTQDKKDWLLTGSKSFITGGQEAEILYVACTTGQMENKHPVLKMLKLPVDLPGIDICNAAELPFVPEVSHGAAQFTDVQVTPAQILPGDGYLDYVKPFRTAEDTHVFGAILGYLLGQALESNWPGCHAEVIVSLILAIRAVSQLPINAASSHIALAGCRSQIDTLIAQLEPDFKLHSPEHYDNWLRDKALLGIAGKAHIKRTETAWLQF